jgi:hypothetical protein
MAVIVKRYGNDEKSLMYRLSVLRNGLISHIELFALNQLPIFCGPVDTRKIKLKLSQAKKEGVFEYLVWLIHYPVEVERILYEKGIKTPQINGILAALDIKNQDLINGIFAVRKAREKQSNKQLSSKRQGKTLLRSGRKR